ncbi:MAG: hypothetical protein OEY00_05210, partial [Gammaproteobacteria bacterium]|nr:hypothetical protein [Gammaproteobacteria bacterium]
KYGGERGRSRPSRQLRPALLYLPPSLAVARLHGTCTSMCNGILNIIYHRDIESRQGYNIIQMTATYLAHVH